MWQGQQEHGWFGHGTKPQSGPSLSSGGPSSASSPGSLDGRIRALGLAAIAGLPASKRQHPAATFDGPALDWLTGATRAWVGGLTLDRAGFAARFFGRAPDNPAVTYLRRAAEIVASAITNAEMRDATGQLIAGMLAVGLDGWPRFLKEAHDRAQANTLAQPIRNTVRRGYPAPANPFGVFIPGSPENEAWVRDTARALGAIGRVFNNQNSGNSSGSGSPTAVPQSSGSDTASLPPNGPDEDWQKNQTYECPSGNVACFGGSEWQMLMDVDQSTPPAAG